MNTFNLTWAITVTFPGRGGNVDAPTWLTVQEKLNEVLGSTGSVGLETEDADGRTRALDVSAENGAYFITFGVETSSDWVVRTYKNPLVQPPGEPIDIKGATWNTQRICWDKALVESAFDEFFKTGDLERENFV